jgi:mono/diheme cytochrome c family protein
MKQLRMSRNLLAIVGLLLPVCWGCGRTPVPHYRLNEVEIASKELPANQQQVISDVLFALFGTPDQPYLPPDSGLDKQKVELASGPVWNDVSGQQGGLYRRHCVHCHGTSGDGMGPTAAVLHPYPRDYRRGLFKFKSTQRANEPTDLDLERIIREGANGTAMPSFDLLPEGEVSALVEYVKYLSLRGQTEIGLISAMSEMGASEWKDLAKTAGVWSKAADKAGVKSEADEEKLDDEAVVKIALAPEGLLEVERAFLGAQVVGEDKIVAGVVTKWREANSAVIQPPERSEMSAEELELSIAKGRELFYTKANCVKCHGPSELGDGQTTDYDDWTKPLVEMAKQVEDSRKSIAADSDLSSAERSKQLAAVYAKARALEYDSLPPRTITPRNLRLGVYRGGRRPLDLYRRLHAGINGTPMPNLFGTPGISPDDIWNLVDFVRSLPYESISKPTRQQKIIGREQM